MGCVCCGGPLVGGTGSGFVTSAKYQSDGNVVWWVDSGRTNNAGRYFNGVYYELSGQIGGGNTILRTIDPDTGEEIDRRDMGHTRQPLCVYENDGNLYTVAITTSTYRIDKIDTSDLSSEWTFDQALSSTHGGALKIVQGDIVVAAFTVASVEKFRAYSNGTTQLWEIDRTTSQVALWHFIDSSNQFVGSGNNALRRFDSSGSSVDTYTPSPGGGSASIHNAINDGSDIWCKMNTGSVDYFVKLNSSLSEAFSPASASVQNGTARGVLSPVSGAVYHFGTRYVHRITSAGSVSQRFDNGGATQMHSWVLHGDQSRFSINERPSLTARLRSYADTAAPASLSYSLDPSLREGVDTTHMEPRSGHLMTTDPSGNTYVSGVRLADTSLDKVP